MKRKVKWDLRLVQAFAFLFLASALAVRLSTITTRARIVFVATILLGFVLLVRFLVRLARSRPWLRYVFAAVAILIVSWAVFGGRQPDTQMLREAYVRHLGSFTGTRFVWGGETSYGIDCSGLARTALWQAMLERGIREANPRLLGPSLWKFWWQDVSASALSRGVYGYTEVIGHAPKLAGYDTSGLRAGDVAVVSETHVLIYYGNGKWIEASPDDRKVVINAAPADSKRGWFNGGYTTLIRWWILK